MIRKKEGYSNAASNILLVRGSHPIQNMAETALVTPPRPDPYCEPADDCSFAAPSEFALTLPSSTDSETSSLAGFFELSLSQSLAGGKLITFSGMSATSCSWEVRFNAIKKDIRVGRIFLSPTQSIIGLRLALRQASVKLRRRALQPAATRRRLFFLFRLLFGYCFEGFLVGRTLSQITVR